LRESLERVRNYELMVIVSPDVTEEDLAPAIERVATLISTAGGTLTYVTHESPWGRRRLAYPIRHNSHDVRDGFYVLHYFEIESDQIVEIERDLKLDDQVIRYLLTLQLAPPVIVEPEPESEPSDEEIVAAPVQEATAPVVVEEVEAPAEVEEVEAPAEVEEVEAPAEVVATEPSTEVVEAEAPAAESETAGFAEELPVDEPAAESSETEEGESES
jgi:small subunit ribosomal protein S6